MIIPLFNARSTSSTEKFIFGNRSLGTSLIRYSQGEVASTGVGPVSRAVISRPYASVFKLFCAEVVEVEQGGSKDSDLYAGLGGYSEDDWLLQLAPGIGPVTKGRIESLVELIETGVEGDMLVSAMPVIANCNPAWLKAMRHEYVTDNAAMIDDFHRDFSFPFKLVNCGLTTGAQDATSAKPLGSQWLPELYHQDGAVVAFRCSALGTSGMKERSRIVPAPSERGQPLLYRMPFFQMSPSMPIQWEVSEDSVEKLMAPAPEHSQGAYAKAN